MEYLFKKSTYIVSNPENNEWIAKYNDLVLANKSNLPVMCGKKLSKHHIIPKSVAPEISKDKNNFVYLPIPEHMMLHYYLWKADPIYAKQLWFGCVWCRKNKIWNLPGGDAEYDELKKSLKICSERNKRTDCSTNL